MSGTASCHPPLNTAQAPQACAAARRAHRSMSPTQTVVRRRAHSLRTLFAATSAEVRQLFARSVIATLRPCRRNRSVRFSLPPFAAPPFRTLHDFFQRLHVFWRSTTKALAITVRDKFREGALPRFLLPVSQRPEFSGIQSQFASHLDMRMAQPETLPRFKPRLKLRWYRHQCSPLRQRAAVNRSTAA